MEDRIARGPQTSLTRHAHSEGMPGEIAKNGRQKRHNPPRSVQVIDSIATAGIRTKPTRRAAIGPEEATCRPGNVVKWQRAGAAWRYERTQQSLLAFRRRSRSSQQGAKGRRGLAGVTHGVNGAWPRDTTEACGVPCPPLFAFSPSIMHTDPRESEGLLGTFWLFYLAFLLTYGDHGEWGNGDRYRRFL